MVKAYRLDRGSKSPLSDRRGTSVREPSTSSDVLDSRPFFR
jgi:hypothetical protein